MRQLRKKTMLFNCLSVLV